MGRRRRTLYLMTVFRWILSLRVEEAKGFVWTQRSRLRRIPTRCRNTLSSVQLASSSSSCSCSCPQHVVLAQCHWKSRTTLSRQRTLHGRRRNNAHRCFSSYNEQDDQDPVLRSLKESFRDCILPHIPTTNNNNDDDDDDDNTMLPVVLGVSGGCDSVGLFHALVEVLEKEEGEDGQWRLSSSCGERAVPIDLHVVHFDHRQRGSESDGDRIFVQNLCNDFRIPCHVYYWEENEHQAASFSQETARAWRRTTMYALLSSLTSSSSSPTRTTGTGVLLTAHHRDDSAETMLLKLLRGVHLTNIAGMEQAIAFPNDMPRAVVARPLLRVSKAQIQDFLTTRGLEWREDSSNASNKYKRNRVRNELIPLLSDIVGDEATLLKRLETLSQQSLELKGYLDGKASAYVKESGTTSEQFVLPSSGTLDTVQKKALHEWSAARMEGHTVSYHLLQRVCHQLQDYPDRLQWSLNVGKGWNIVRRGNILDVNRDNATTGAANVEETRLRWSTMGRGDGDDDDDSVVVAVRVRLMPPTAREPVFLLSTAANASKWPFTPPWRSGPLKVKDFLRGQKIPLHQRPDIPIIYTTTDAEPTEKVVALLVNDKWVVDAHFDAAPNDDNEPTVAIHLPTP